MPGAATAPFPLARPPAPATAPPTNLLPALSPPPPAAAANRPPPPILPPPPPPPMSVARVTTSFSRIALGGSLITTPTNSLKVMPRVKRVCKGRADQEVRLAVGVAADGTGKSAQGQNRLCHTAVSTRSALGTQAGALCVCQLSTCKDTTPTINTHNTPHSPLAEQQKTALPAPHHRCYLLLLPQQQRCERRQPYHHHHLALLLPLLLLLLLLDLRCL